MRWKTAQKKAKLQRKVRLAALTLILIISVVLIGNLARVVHGLFSPLSIQTARTYHWDSNFNLNLILTTKPISVLSYNPVESKIAILKIPDEAYIEVPGGFGSWKIGNVYKLGQSENPPKGAALLKASVESFLAIPIDGVVETSGQWIVDSGQLVAALRGNPLNYFSLLSALKTDLSPVELGKFILGIRGVRFDKIQTYNLKELGLLSPDLLADGSPVLVSDSSKIDLLVAKNFTDTKVLGESASIAVLNSTEKPGLAAKTARIISHLGGNVIIQGGFPQTQDKSIVTGDGQFPYTIKRLKQIFGSACESEKDCDTLLQRPLSRASVNLILGQQ